MATLATLPTVFVAVVVAICATPATCGRCGRCGHSLSSWNPSRSNGLPTLRGYASPPSPAFSRADRRLGQAAPQAPNLEGDEPVQPTKTPRSVCALIGAVPWSATGVRAFSLRFRERAASPCFYVIRQGHGSTDVTHDEAKALHLDRAFGRRSRDDGTSVVVNEHALTLASTDFCREVAGAWLGLSGAARRESSRPRRPPIPSPSRSSFPAPGALGASQTEERRP